MELWDAYTIDGTKVEDMELTRGEDIPLGVYHLVADVVVQHVDGTYLLMKRSYDKPKYPGFEEIGAGGSVLKGESSLDGAIRELKEETGLTAKSIMLTYTYISTDTLYDIYLAIVDCDKDDVKLQEGETMGCRWVTKDELVKFFYTYKCMYSQRMGLKPFINNIVDYRIVHLKDHPEYQPLASQWLADKWSMPQEKYFLSMQKSRNGDNAIPQWYVALEGYRMVGAVGVIEYDNHEEKELTPNICSLYVEEDSRNKGIARALLNYAEEDMSLKGVNNLYLLTKLQGYCEKLSWKYLKEVKRNNTLYRVYQKEV